MSDTSPPPAAASIDAAEARAMRDDTVPSPDHERSVHFAEASPELVEPPAASPDKDEPGDVDDTSAEPAAEPAAAEPAAAPAGAQADPASADVSDDTATDEEEPLEFGERLYCAGVRTQRRRDRAYRREQQQRARGPLPKEATFTPKISATSKAMKEGNFQDFYRGVMHRTEQAEKTFEKKKKELHKEEMGESDVFAKGNAVKDRLKKEGKYRDPVSGWDERFAHFMGQTDHRAQQQQSAARSQRGSQRAPTSAASTARRRVAGETAAPLFERLFNEAQTRVLARSIVEQAQEESYADLFRPRTEEVHGELMEADTTTQFPQEWAQADEAVASPVPGAPVPTRATATRRLFNSISPTGESQPNAVDTAVSQYEQRYGPLPDHRSSRHSETGSVASSATATSAAVRDVMSRQRAPTAVVGDLLTKGEEYRRRKEERQRHAVRDSVKDCTFAPQTNSGSRLLVQRHAFRADAAEEDLPSTVCTDDVAIAAVAAMEGSTERERIYGRAPAFRTEREALAHAKAVAAGRRKAEQSGNPSDARSPRVGARFDKDIFCARMQRQEAERHNRLAERRREEQRRKVAGCTFRPALASDARDPRPEAPSVSRSYLTMASDAPLHDASQISVPARSPAAARRAPPASHHASSSPATTRVRIPAVNAVHTAPPPTSVHTSMVADGGDSPVRSYLDGLEDELRGVIDDWRTV